MIPRRLALSTSFADRVKVLALAFVLVSLSFALQGKVGINFADEGFLWYGTQWTARGELPLRDFQSYDPGRYYWGAAWFKVLGDGIVALRLSIAAFQFIGLSCGLLILRRVLHGWSLLVPAGVVLLAWMFPLYRVFETAPSMSAIWVAVHLLEKPTIPRHLAAGTFVGAVALLGRNLGVYTFLAFLALILFHGVTTPGSPVLKRLLAFAAAIPVGYSPMLLLFTLPGFFPAFVDSVLTTVGRGSTNYSLPVPWPWRVYPYLGDLGLSGAVRLVTVGTLFLLMPIFFVVAVVLLLSSRPRASRHPVLLASTFVGVVYMHHAFSRADLEHLALSIHPFLIGVLTLAAVATVRYRLLIATAAVAALVFMSSVSVAVVSPGYRWLSARETYRRVDVAGDTLWLDPPAAALTQRVQSLTARVVAPTEGLLVGPHFPAFYSILRRKSPLWEIYFLLPSSVERQLEMVARLRSEHVDWALIHDVRLDGRDDRRLANTHPILWKHLIDEFESIRTSELPSSYYLFHRKRTAPEPPR